ncbi:MAG: hypothetical protein JWR04_824 [Rhodoglobus sp.]|nr:hypothetical protein [Rhodoglobus sp.]
MPEQSPYEDLARGALLEITPASTVGPFVGTTDEGDGIVSVLFASAQAGYPDWKWTVSIAQVPGEEPTVLEVELMPAEGALLAPDWVPWSDRLAEYKAAQENAAPEDDSDESDEDDESDDDDDDDDDSDDEDSDDELDEDDVLGNDVLHGGDLDGVDIDDLDSDESDDDDDFDDDADDDEEVDRTY